MWTDFNGGDERAMGTAPDQMNDVRLIRNPDQTRLSPGECLARLHDYASSPAILADAVSFG
jgi:hypothetical protein